MEKSLTDSLISGIPGVYFVLDQRLMLVRWNDEFARLTGFTGAAATSFRLLSQMVEEDQDVAKTAIDRTFSQGDGVFDARMKTVEGVRRFHFVLRRLCVDDGLCVAGSGHDISEHDPVTLALPVTESSTRVVLANSGLSVDFLRLAHELVGIGSYVLNLRTRTLYFSSEMSLLLGMGESPMDMPIEEYRRRFYAPESYAPTSQTGDAAYAAGKYLQMDAHIICADGRDIWVRTASVPRTDDEGDPVRVGMLRDITESKRAEDALRESETRFRSAFMTGAIAFVLVEETTGRLLEVNDHFLELYGWRREEVIGRTSLELGMWATPADRAALLAQLQTQDKVVNVEVHARSKHGDMFWVLYSVNRLNMQGSKLMLGAILDISARKEAERQVADYVKQLEGTLESTLQAVSAMVEMRDPYTAGHERRVGAIAADIAREMGWPEDRCHSLELIGLVHDIGKIAIPSEILVKPAKLEDIEFELVKTHAEKGYEILKNIRSQTPIGDIIRQHHERMDGSGYPQGLKGEEILMEARILAVADVLESMASHRPYRPALGVDAALKEIESGRGTKFDEVVADTILRMVRQKAYRLPQ